MPDTKADNHAYDIDYHVRVHGKTYDKLPDDLFIPPEALEVFLESFEGPLDILLYLIRKQNFDILNIPIVDITRQYIQYVELMKDHNLTLAAEYLLMSAMLAEIKSRMMLPKIVQDDEDEDIDPRAELARKLLIYEQYKQAGQDLQERPQQGRDFFTARANVPETDVHYAQIPMDELMQAFHHVLERQQQLSSHHIDREHLSIKQKMLDILALLNKAQGFVSFESILTSSEGRSGVITSFLAILELLKSQTVDIVQQQSGDTIYIQTA